MSTRCHIAVYREEIPEKPTQKDFDSFEALLYRHSDGYPSAVLPDVMPFLKWWDKKRGVSDSEYVAARLLQYLCNMYDASTEDFESKYAPKKPEKGLTGTLGHGICKGFHGDIEYLYAITPKALTVFSTNVKDGGKIGVKRLGSFKFEDNPEGATKVCETKE